jgi:fucose 4-O-acetylase-like acetyltransferase
MTTSAKRIQWIDIARGIGIILVVYAHAARGLVLSEVLPSAGWPITVDTVIYAFHMPLFFILPGLNVERGVARGRRDFIVNKLQTIAWPYFLWSLVGGGLKLVAKPYTNNPISPADIIAIPIAPIEQFWFLYVLFFCQLFIAIILPRRWLLAALTLLGVIAWSTVAEESIFFRILHYLPYVVAGLFAVPILAELAKRRAGQWAVLASAWLIFAFLILPTAPPAQLAPIIYALALLGSAGTIALAMILDAASLPMGWLEHLGRLSMPIFIMHTIFSAAMRAVLKIAGLSDSVMTLALVTIAGIVLSLLAYRIAAAMNLTQLLGFGPPVKR